MQSWACHISEVTRPDPRKVLREFVSGTEPVFALFRKGEWCIGRGIAFARSGAKLWTPEEMAADSSGLDGTRAPGVPRDLAPRFFHCVSFDAPWDGMNSPVWTIMAKETLIISPTRAFKMDATGAGSEWESPTHKLGVQRDLDSWCELLSRVQEPLREGLLSKVVMARFEIHESNHSAVDTFESLLGQDPESKAFFIRFPSGASFYAATPETLVAMEQDRIWTHALAGSIRRGSSGREDAQLRQELLSSAKDILEHELVAAHVRECLATARAGDVEQAPRGVRILKHVQHLETLITARNSGNTTICDLAHRFHPTPAVCGTPRDEARRTISNLEGFTRGLYSGSIGWSDTNGQGAFLVALRCALQIENQVAIFAGAGILSQSDPDAEWAETERKLAGLRQAIL